MHPGCGKMKKRLKKPIHIKYLRGFVIFSLILFIEELIALFLSVLVDHAYIYLAILSMVFCLISGWAYLYRLKEIHSLNANIATQLVQDWYSALALMVPVIAEYSIVTMIVGYCIMGMIFGNPLAWTIYVPSYYVYILILALFDHPYMKLRRYAYRFIAPRKDKDNYIYIY